MIHEHSKIAHDIVKPSKENVRKAIRHILFKCSEALTDSELLERVQWYMSVPTITINSVAPRITEMLQEEPPRLKVVGLKEYKGLGGRKIKRRTTRPMSETEQYDWMIEQKKREKEKEQPQQLLFSKFDV